MNYFVVYYYQFPLRGNFDFSVRPLSRYIGLLADEGKPVKVYSPEQSSLFTKYLFYTDGLSKSTLPSVKAAIQSRKYSLQNVIFLSCPGINDLKDKNRIHVIDANCGKLPEHANALRIRHLRDGGEAYLILNDNLCKKYSLKAYPSNLRINDFAIEDMNRKMFCETFISR